LVYCFNIYYIYLEIVFYELKLSKGLPKISKKGNKMTQYNLGHCWNKELYQRSAEQKYRDVMIKELILILIKKKYIMVAEKEYNIA
jgi:hypothetical protein